MSRINGDPAPLHARNRREVTIQLIRIARLLYLVLIRSLLFVFVRLRERHSLLFLLCGLYLLSTRRCRTKVHDDAGLFAVKRKYFPAVLVDRSLHYDANRCGVELRHAHTRNERRVDGDILLCLGCNPCILHVDYDARRIGQNALLVGNRAFGVDDDTDVPIGFSNANARDLCHVLCTVAERGFCRDCRTKSNQTNKDHGKQ